jgi:hypothetical protein
MSFEFFNFVIYSTEISPNFIKLIIIFAIFICEFSLGTESIHVCFHYIQIKSS